MWIIWVSRKFIHIIHIFVYGQVFDKRTYVRIETIPSFCIEMLTKVRIWVKIKHIGGRI